MPESLCKAASVSASLGLDIDPRGLAYLVPYKNNAEFQIGYLGMIELAYRSGRVKHISANCIYESEKESVEIHRVDGAYSVVHPFCWDPPTGEMIAVYATAVVDGISPVTTVLRRDEIERLRSISKAPNSPAWSDHYDAMAKKTAIRQLVKFLPKSLMEELSHAAAHDERQQFGDCRRHYDDAVEVPFSEVADKKVEESKNTPAKGSENTTAEWASR